MNKILQGDCLQVLKELPENSVDAIITDPPYGLEFMGKNWDRGVPGIPFWKEMIRVLKPGGYLLSFGGTRTYHRMTCGIEDAGFEIRDCIMWLYGSGFPKSLNIGKQIDKIQGNEREVVGDKLSPDGQPYKNRQPKEWKPQGFAEREDWKRELSQKETKGSSEWEGWGTALKPACEPIVVARKPLSEKNVALNVLKWGTGGINIDACRIEHNEDASKSSFRPAKENVYSLGFKKHGNQFPEYNSQGRFPANIILDEEAGKMLDEQSGELKSGGGKTTRKNDDALFDFGKDYSREEIRDKGGASRFFYCAKASKGERNLGLDEFEDKDRVDYGGFHSEKGLITNNRNPERRLPSKNNHPTVKPIKLMEYLIRLVTKENAIVLDPFLGSGTTAIACAKLGRKFIGVEKEEEYIKIATARLKPFLEQEKLQ